MVRSLLDLEYFLAVGEVLLIAKTVSAVKVGNTACIIRGNAASRCVLVGPGVQTSKIVA